ncbi:MAG: VCBS repeat-containing protein, partial [Verrucomicrobiota bacterium]
MTNYRNLIIGLACSLGLEAAVASTAIEKKPFAESASNPGKTLFEKLSAERTGVDFVYQSVPRKHKGASTMFGASTSGTTSGGVCIGDYDNDGRPDLYLTQPSGKQRLYRNLGGFRFEDATEKAGVDGGGI